MDERRDETTLGGEATESQTAPVEGLVILSFKTQGLEVGIVVTCPHLMAMSAVSPVRRGKCKYVGMSYNYERSFQYMYHFARLEI